MEYVVFGVELQFDTSGMIDLRRIRDTPLNKIVNTMIVPFLAENCPHALLMPDDKPVFQVRVYIKGEVLAGGLLRKKCPGYGDSHFSASVESDPDNAGAFLAGTWQPVSAVGLEGVPEMVITRELMDEEELFAPRSGEECPDPGYGQLYLSQFKTRFGY